MFNNTGHVLRWAYTTTAEQIIEISSANRMRQEPSRGMNNMLVCGFSAQERHIQAAQILGEVARLSDPAAAEYIGAKFGHRTSAEELRILTYRCCDAVGLGLSNSRAIHLMLVSYFSAKGKLPYRAVRSMLGCRDQYALMIKSCLYDTLDLIHDRAMEDLKEKFEGSGLIRARCCA